MEAMIKEIIMENYSAYKDSGAEWLGEIPEHWESVRMKHLFRDVSIKKMPGAELLSVTQDQGVVPRTRVEIRMVMPSGALESFKFINKGDFAISLRSFEGGLEYCHHDGIISPAYTVLKAQGNLNNQYYKYLFKSFSFISELQTNVVGIRQGKNISYDELSYSFIPFPPIDEQIAITQFLDRKTTLIDKAIGIKEKQIELLKEHRQILIHKAVTRGLNPNTKMKDSGVEWVGEIPEHWEVKPLKYLSKVQSGITLGKTYHAKELNKYPYLRVANVQAGYFDLDEIAEISLPKNIAKKYFITTGDILVTEGGDLDKLGRGTVWNGEIENCLHQNHIFCLRITSSKTSAEFTSIVMESNYGRRYFTNTANKTTNLASTNITKLGKLPIIIPPKNEQESISTYIKTLSSKIFASILLKEIEIEKLTEYKSTLINSAVTGKIKVCSQEMN
jgi:type I restriction enzyme S subunit